MKPGTKEVYKKVYADKKAGERDIEKSEQSAEIEKLKHDHEILVNTILESKEKMLGEVLNSKKYICLNRSQRLSIEPLCSKCQYKKKCKWKDFKQKIAELREGK